MKLQGLRTFVFSIVALAFLLAGLYLCLVYPQAGMAIFTSFAGAIVFIVAAVAGKSAVGQLAQGTGVRGAAAALWTSAKPGEPPPPGTP